MGNSYLLLGNGFSIDIIKKLNKEDQIDLVNLFSKGTNVCYPKTVEKGFLSRKYTPSLWTLGARTYNSNEESLQLITDIIDVYGFTDTGANIIIYKPHGSISFSFRIKVQESSPYSIRAAVEESIAQEAENFEIKYDLSEDYPIVNAIIPPAGDSTRLNLGWIKEIRQGIEEITKESTSKDEIILFGISYWHVDRNEIDDILISINSQMEVKYVNPAPPTSLDAVLSSLFANYIHYSKGALLKEEL